MNDTITYKILRADDIHTGLFDYFTRRQEVTKCLRRRGGEWVVKDARFIDDWNADDHRKLTDFLSALIDRGGFAYGAYYMGALKGFAAVEPELFCPEHMYMDLTDIHVSLDMRGKHIGKTLFEAAKAWAKARGARKLYISAHSSVESQAFYRAMGCVDACEINQKHADEEPYDRQMECPLY